MELQLEPGEDATPFYTECPKCGCDLLEYPVDPVADQSQAEQIEKQPGKRWAASMAGYFKAIYQTHLKRMVDPLAQADEEAAERNQGDGDRGQVGKQPSASEQKHQDADKNNHFIPVIQDKFR